LHAGRFAGVHYQDGTIFYKKKYCLFIKEYFYCYFVVKRRECISLDCIMLWELPGRFSSLIQQMAKCNSLLIDSYFVGFFFCFFNVETVLSSCEPFLLSQTDLVKLAVKAF